MKVKATKEEIENWKNELKDMISHMERPELYTILKHVSRSGMMRSIQVIAIVNNQPLYLGYRIAGILDMPYDEKNEGVKIGGCGMDMGFALVYDLSSVLYKDEERGAYKINQRWL